MFASVVMAFFVVYGTMDPPSIDPCGVDVTLRKQAHQSLYTVPWSQRYRAPKVVAAAGQSGAAKSFSRASILGNKRCALNTAPSRTLGSSLSKVAMKYTPPCHKDRPRAVKPQKVRAKVSTVSKRN